MLQMNGSANQTENQSEMEKGGAQMEGLKLITTLDAAAPSPERCWWWPWRLLTAANHHSNSNRTGKEGVQQSCWWRAKTEQPRKTSLLVLQVEAKNDGLQRNGFEDINAGGSWWNLSLRRLGTMGKGFAGKGTVFFFFLKCPTPHFITKFLY